MYLSFLLLFLSKAPSEVDRWIEKYASTSIVNAFNKGVPEELRINDAQLEKVLSGRSVIVFKSPLFSRTKEYKEFDLFALDATTRWSASDPWAEALEEGKTIEEADELDARQQEMLKNAEKALLERKADELVILDIGAIHAYDLFFSFFLKGPESPLLKHKDEALFFRVGMKMNTGLRSESFYNFEDLRSGVKEPRDTVKDRGVYFPTTLLGRIFYHRRLALDRFTKKDLLQEEKPKFGYLVYMDWHGIDSTDAMDDLPSAKALKEIGFKKITILTENFKADKTYKLEDYRQLFTLTPSDLKDEFSKSNKKLVKFLEDKPVIEFPAAKALYQKLLDYQENGLKVTVGGVENVERIAPLQ